MYAHIWNSNFNFSAAYFDFAYDAVFALAYGIRDIVAAGVVPPDPITDEWRGLLSEHILTETSFEGISKVWRAPA